MTGIFHNSQHPGNPGNHGRNSQPSHHIVRPVRQPKPPVRSFFTGRSILFSLPQTHLFIPHKKCFYRYTLLSFYSILNIVSYQVHCSIRISQSNFLQCYRTRLPLRQEISNIQSHPDFLYFAFIPRGYLFLSVHAPDLKAA